MIWLNNLNLAFSQIKHQERFIFNQSRKLISKCRVFQTTGFNRFVRKKISKIYPLKGNESGKLPACFPMATVSVILLPKMSS